MKLKHRIVAALLALNLSLAPIAPALANDLSNSTWSETDASNNNVSPNGWKSGTMLPSEVEPVGRAMMGAIKRWHDQISPVLTSGGTANAQTLTHTVAKAAYVAGDLFGFIAGATNTGSLTVNVDALGAKTVKIGTSSLVGGEVPAGAFVLMGYDGTNLQLLRGSIGTLLSTAGAILNAFPSDPTGTTSTTAKMMGLGVTTCRFTPTYSSRVQFTLYGTISNNTNGDGAQVSLAHGTGSGPANAAAATGTVDSHLQQFVAAAANQLAPFFVTANVASLTPGMTYWFDAQLLAITGGTATILKIGCNASEI